MFVTTAFAPVAYAQVETRYVTDQLEITMRSGTSTQNSIVRMLRSGTAIEVIETDDESGYSRVRMSSGTEGWVLTRFLMTEPSSREQLVTLRRRMSNSDKAQAELSSEF